MFPPYDCEIADLYRAMGQIIEFLKAHVYQEIPVFGHQGKLACVAHSHLDIAYHWKVGQTVQKNARTCLIQLRLMDRYPEFTYSHTQAWTYEMLEEFYPELFEEVKQRISEGRWEIVGGMYVEPDCNIPSAESLVRQIVYGKRYFLEKFGIEVDNCWLPDVFGNSAILPQILKLGGIPYFVSNKMSTWNDTNLFPHNNFLWKGLDGSEVYACVPPVHFISWMDPNDLAKHWETFLDKDWCDESLHMYGYGDGGSGVTEDMLETFPRIQKMAGLPQVRQTTGKEYLHSVFDNIDNSELPVWDGELYLEMHRGTFTTKGDLKRENRKGELLAYVVESLCVMATLNGKNYPSEKISKTWKKLLLNQFHDIVPGSHTQPVFLDAMETYSSMVEDFDKLKKDAMNIIAPESEIDDVCIINPFSDCRSGIAVLKNNLDSVTVWGKSLSDFEGRTYPIQDQYVPQQNISRTVTAIPDITSFSSTNFKLVDSGQKQLNDSFIIKPSYMENNFFTLTFDDNHCLVSIFDKKRSRQVLPPGTIGNEWQIFEDKPGKYNAWDILPNYVDHRIEINNWQNVDIVEEGPLSIALKFTRTFSKSRAELVIRLHAEIPRIDFESWVDWQETEKLLKVAFPVNVKSRYFTTDTSAGGLERENHRNTSWQKAKFEVTMHKWVDLSEGLFGVTLLNDCKYGCDINGNVMRISLLRAPIRPDRVSDKGEHRFTYSLFTHNGDWRTGGVTEAAYVLNAPLTAIIGHHVETPENTPVLSIDTMALKCQSFKCAEDGSGDIILRLVEVYGSHGTAVIHPTFSFQEVTICDLLERTIDTVTFTSDRVKLSYLPYQIQTIRFKR
ncbi:MAG: glycosyl hydrolase-related protein [Spirochaetaceae bacterium]